MQEVQINYLEGNKDSKIHDRDKLIISYKEDLSVNAYRRTETKKIDCIYMLSPMMTYQRVNVLLHDLEGFVRLMWMAHCSEDYAAIKGLMNTIQANVDFHNGEVEKGLKN
jgi:hypothetical protein